MPPPRAWPKAALMAVTTIKSTYSLEVESVRAGGVGTSLDGVEVRSVAAGSCLCSVGHPPGSAGVPPASLFLQTACHPRPLPCKAHQTRLYGVLFHRAGVCAGETPALPGGLCAGGTPALPGGSLCGRDARAPGGGGGVTPSPRPTLGGSLSSILQRLSGPLAVLRGPSWITLFAFLWISYVSWLCSSATISRATSRARSGWPGGREMAATTGWPPPP